MNSGACEGNGAPLHQPQSGTKCTAAPPGPAPPPRSSRMRAIAASHSACGGARGSAAKAGRIAVEMMPSDMSLHRPRGGFRAAAACRLVQIRGLPRRALADQPAASGRAAPEVEGRERAPACLEPRAQRVRGGRRTPAGAGDRQAGGRAREEELAACGAAVDLEQPDLRPGPPPGRHARAAALLARPPLGAAGRSWAQLGRGGTGWLIVWGGVARRGTARWESLQGLQGLQGREAGNRSRRAGRAAARRPARAARGVT